MPQSARAVQPTTLSLGPASRYLGVDPDTLRRWADQGRVEVFLTPGGHRRFDARSLERIRRSGGQPRATLSGLGLTLERVVATYRRTYGQPVEGRPDPRVLAGGNGHEVFREEGRRLVDALIRQLDESEGSAREAALAEAIALTRSHAVRLTERGAPLIDGVAVFVAARQPFLAQVGALARRRSLDPQQLTRLYEEATALLDRLLLEFIDGYRIPSRSQP